MRDFTGYTSSRIQRLLREILVSNIRIGTGFRKNSWWIKLAVIITLFLLALTYSILKFSIPGKIYGIVTYTNDGDTISIITRENKKITVRLWGIDCPEMNQEYGDAAEKFSRRHLKNKSVTVHTMGRDDYGRILGIVYVEGNPTPINELLVQNGYAWVYTRTCTKEMCYRWKELEDRAKKNGLGLWAQPKAMPPWKWREKHRS